MVYWIIAWVAVIFALMVACMKVSAHDEELGEWYEYLEFVCDQKSICPEFVQAIIERESSWNPQAVNGDCKGLMQISESCHGDRMARLAVDDLFDPYDNILVGVDYLAELFEKYEDAGTVLAVYHGEKGGASKASEGIYSSYTQGILERAEQLERLHGK